MQDFIQGKKIVMSNSDIKNEKIMVTRASMPPFEEYEELIKGLWNSHFLTNMGCLHEEFREKLKSYLNTTGLELFVNGHTALEMLIQSFELRGEVITTPFTFASTTHAIYRNGLKPVMCDVKPEDGTMNPELIEALITENTSAIVPVHVYGNICDYEKIEDIARKHGLKVIYDAAHAFGEFIENQDGSRISAAGLGDASMFSFHATKVFNSIEGGAVSFDEERYPFLSDRLYQIKNFGITGKESVEYIGGNGKMNEFAAAMGICNLRHVDSWIESRKMIYRRYEERLSDIRGIRFLKRSDKIKYNYSYMPVVFEKGLYNRDEIYDRLAQNNIYARKYFYPCVNNYKCYEGILDPFATPCAASLAENVLTLPVYPELSLKDVDRICDIILFGA